MKISIKNIANLRICTNYKKKIIAILKKTTCSTSIILANFSENFCECGDSNNMLSKESQERFLRHKATFGIPSAPTDTILFSC